MNSSFSKGGGGSGEEPSYPQLDLSGKLIIKVYEVINCCKEQPNNT